MNFLMTRLGPLPVWVWGVGVIGGIVLYFVIKKYRGGGSTAATLGQNTAGQVNPYNPTNDPNLDPNTGYPYQIEEAIDPNTGEPYYIELARGASSPGQAGGGPGGPTTPVTAGPTTPIPVDQPLPKYGFPPPPQPVPTPTGFPIAFSAAPAGAPTVTQAPVPAGNAARPMGVGTGDEWSYPFWAGQGGQLYMRE